MASTITAALACDFAYAGETFTITLLSTGLTYTVTVAAGTYRILLAQSGKDFLQVLQTALNSATAGAGITWLVQMGTDGRVSITSQGTQWQSTVATSFASTLCAAILGFASTSPYAGTQTAQYRPAYFVTAIEAYSGVWTQFVLGGAEVTTGGQNITVSTQQVQWKRTTKFRHIPKNPSTGDTDGSPASALAPNVGDRTGVVREGNWTWADFCYSAASADCAICLAGDFAALIGGVIVSTNRYRVGTIDPPAAGALDMTGLVERQSETYDKWNQVKLGFTTKPEPNDWGSRV